MGAAASNASLLRGLGSRGKYATSGNGTSSSTITGFYCTCCNVNCLSNSLMTRMMEKQSNNYLFFPGAFESNKSSKPNQKKRTNSMKIKKSYPKRSYETGAGLAYGNEQSTVIGKTPASGIVFVVYLLSAHRLLRHRRMVVQPGYIPRFLLRLITATGG